MIDAILPEFLTQLPAGERTPCHERPDLFVPDWSLEPAEKFQNATPRAERIQHAKSLCAACPLTDACLEHAIRTHQPHGIWGGLTPTERKTTTLRPECGTEQAWRSHLSRHEGCTICRDAHKERQQADRLSRLAEEHRHGGGSLAGYRLELLLGIGTCEACRSARQAYYARRTRTGKWYRQAAA